MEVDILHPSGGLAGEPRRGVILDIVRDAVQGIEDAGSHPDAGDE
jgi:hypothetical protein